MADSGTVSLKRPGTWPRRLRLALEATVTVMTNAYMMARSRAAGSPSKTVSLMAERDDALWRAALAERQLDIFRRRLLNMNPHARPDYLAGDRLLILQIMWLCGWSIVLTAKRFVLHRNTVSSWCCRFRGEGSPGPFFSKPPWNKIGDSVRWLVHEMKSLGMDYDHIRSVGL